MKIVQLVIKHFRGIEFATLNFSGHTVVIGDNNIGKTTIFEALDLALGPDRLSSANPINEHDFYKGVYTNISTSEDENQDFQTSSSLSADSEENPPFSISPKIEITVVLADLDLEQRNTFSKNFIQFWDYKTKAIYETADPEGLDVEHIKEAISVTFVGEYDKEEDDFVGQTYFTRSFNEESPSIFSKKHKRLCGFLYLRSVRTGNRALSLEKGSLLDIILRLNDVRPQMWEKILQQLSQLEIASDPSLGISPVLANLEESLKKYVPREWGSRPHLRLSNFTREHLRRIITAFVATGQDEHGAPFYRQGTGTINMLVLALLSEIAKIKQNVIFAMEEPETAIPPYAQKRIVHEVRNLSAQALFTSHSPYVIEEFSTDEIMVLSKTDEDTLHQSEISLGTIKLKKYKQEFRLRFAEGLLARRVLLAEGATEASALPVACRRLSELDSEKYKSLESLGICVIDAGGETDIPKLAEIYKKLGKEIFVVCDKQKIVQNEDYIRSLCNNLYMHEEKGFENLILNGCSLETLISFGDEINWPQHITWRKEPTTEIKKSLLRYFAWGKGNSSAAECLADMTLDEMPEWIKDTALSIQQVCEDNVSVACSHEENEISLEERSEKHELNETSTRNS